MDPSPDADAPQVSALAINVVIPPELRWTDLRRGEEFELQTLTVRLLPDRSLAVKAYGRPTAGGRGRRARRLRVVRDAGPAGAALAGRRRCEPRR